MFKSMLNQTGNMASARLLCYALPIPVILAESKASKKEKESGNTGRIIKPSNLPIYEGREQIYDFEYHGKEKTQFEEVISVVRREVEVVVESTQEVREAVTNFVETGKAHSLGSLDYIRAEENLPSRIGLISAGVLSGLLLGIRRGFFKKLLYSSIVGGGTASLCYPDQAFKYSKDVVTNANEYSIIAYNFVAGVKPKDFLSDSKPEEKKSLPESTGTPAKEKTPPKAAEVSRVLPQSFESSLQRSSDVTLWGFQLKHSPESNYFEPELSSSSDKGKTHKQKKISDEGKTNVKKTADEDKKTLRKISEANTVEVGEAVANKYPADASKSKVKERLISSEIGDASNNPSKPKFIKEIAEDTLVLVAANVVQEIAEQVAKVASKVSDAAENVSDISDVVEAAADIVESMAEKAGQLPGISDSMAETADRIDFVAEKVDDVVEKVENVTNFVAKIAESAKEIAENIEEKADKIIDDRGDDIEESFHGLVEHKFEKLKLKHSENKDQNYVKPSSNDADPCQDTDKLAVNGAATDSSSNKTDELASNSATNARDYDYNSTEVQESAFSSPISAALYNDSRIDRIEEMEDVWINAMLNAQKEGLDSNPDGVLVIDPRISKEKISEVLALDQEISDESSTPDHQPVFDLELSTPDVPDLELSTPDVPALELSSQENSDLEISTGNLDNDYALQFASQPNMIDRLKSYLKSNPSLLEDLNPLTDPESLDDKDEFHETSSGNRY